MPIRSTHALSVRSLCPFCGSNQDTDGDLCCGEWVANSDSPSETAAAPDGPPRFVSGLVAVALRLNEASQLLVALIASSTIGMLASIGMQSRFIAEYAQIGAAPIRATMMPIPLVQIPTALAKPVPKPPEPATVVRAAAEAPPAASAPSTAPQVVVASLSPALPQGALPAPPAPYEITGPEPPTARQLKTGWSFDDVSKWHRLRRGMSRTAVRMIFGYPQWVDRHTTPHTEYWLYESDRLAEGAWIAFFDNEGPVADWRRP